LKLLKARIWRFVGVDDGVGGGVDDEGPPGDGDCDCDGVGGEEFN
jgi:hypothetical protein